MVELFTLKAKFSKNVEGYEMRARTMSGVVGLVNMSPFLEGEVSKEWSLLINIKKHFLGAMDVEFLVSDFKLLPIRLSCLLSPSLVYITV